MARRGRESSCNLSLSEAEKNRERPLSSPHQGGEECLLEMRSGKVLCMSLCVTVCAFWNLICSTISAFLWIGSTKLIWSESHRCIMFSCLYFQASPLLLIPLLLTLNSSPWDVKESSAKKVSNNSSPVALKCSSEMFYCSLLPRGEQQLLSAWIHRGFSGFQLNGIFQGMTKTSKETEIHYTTPLHQLWSCRW